MGRDWRRYAAPAAFLLAATIAIVLIRSGLESGGTPAATSVVTTTTTVPAARRYYRVRAGDTLQLISKRSHVPLAELRRLNPKVSPTTLRIGERIRIR